MKGLGVNAVLLALVIVTAALNWSIVADPKRPNVEFLPGMVRAPALDAYSPNPYSPSDKADPPLPPGVITLGSDTMFMPEDSIGAAMASATLRNPWDGDTESTVDRGAYLYRDFCLPCHGPEGGGDGPVARRGYPPPTRLDIPATPPTPDGKLFHIITYGVGNMPGYRAQIPPADRWRIIAYLRRLQSQAKVPGADTLDVIQ